MMGRRKVGPLPEREARLRTAQELLRVVCDHCGIRQYVIARRLGLSDAVISAWRTGRRPPNPDQLSRLIELMGGQRR